MRKLILLFTLLSAHLYGQVSDATLVTQSNQVKNETTPGQNTATRVGTLFLNIANSKGNKQEANTWTALQTFTASSTNAGLKFGTRTTDPSGVTDGQAYYNTSTDKLMVADGSAYVEIGGGGSFEYLEVLESAPGSPSQGRIYMDASSGVTYTYDGVTWNRQLQGNINDDFIPIGVSGSLATDAGLKFVGGVTLYTESLRILDLVGGSTRMLVVETDGDVAAQTIPSAGTSGSYTPTLTDGSNVAAHTVYDLYYTQVGDVVHVFGAIGVDPTAGSTGTTISVSLPVASNFGDVDEVGGSGTAEVSGGGYVPFFFFSDSTNNRVQINFISGGTGNHFATFSFSYVVI